MFLQLLGSIGGTIKTVSGKSKLNVSISTIWGLCMESPSLLLQVFYYCCMHLIHIMWEPIYLTIEYLRSSTSKLFKTHTQEHSFAWEQEQNVRWRTPCKYFSYIGISSWLVVFKSTTLRLYVYVYVMCMHLFTLTQTFY